MSYIAIVNPAILSTSGTGMPFSGVLSATVLVAFSMTLMMGLYAKLPFAVAPGMGLNAFFAYTIILQDKVPWQTALGIVFWAGVLFLLISATPLRERIATAIPPNLRLGTAAGIGLLLTLIGLRNAGLIEPDPATMVRLGTIDYRAVLVLGGLIVGVVLMRRGNPLAFLSSIFAVTASAWALGYEKTPEQIVSLPDFSSVALKLDVWGALQLSLLPAIVSILFTDLFDSLSTFIGVATAAGLTEPDGRPLNLRRGLIVGRHRALFPPVLLRRAACRRGACLCDRAGTGARRRRHVPDGVEDRLHHDRGWTAGVRHAGADSDYLLDHAGHPVRLHPACGSLRVRRSRAGAAHRALAARRTLRRPALSSIRFSW